MNPYIFIAIGLVIVLIAVFFITYVLNKRTPVPKGCENIKISEEGCMSCLNTECHIKQGLDIQKIEEELKEDK